MLLPELLLAVLSAVFQTKTVDTAGNDQALWMEDSHPRENLSASDDQTAKAALCSAAFIRQELLL